MKLLDMLDFLEKVEITIDAKSLVLLVAASEQAISEVDTREHVVILTRAAIDKVEAAIKAKEDAISGLLPVSP
jgi:hypothetical protein